MTNDSSDQPVEKSKSQKKREADALQELGKQLTELSAEQLAGFSLSDQLHQAIIEAGKIRHHGARKRHLQYIGKLMRNIDASPIQQRLTQIQNQHQLHTRQFHQIEQWRDQLISNSPEAMDELLANCPDIDRQHLRQLIRNAQKEVRQQQPSKAFRALFRYLRDSCTDED